MKPDDAEVLRLREIEQSARSRYERLSRPIGIGDAGVLKAAEDLWLEANAVLVAHEDRR